jgi:hypothetical protein
MPLAPAPVGAALSGRLASPPGAVLGQEAGACPAFTEDVVRVGQDAAFQGEAAAADAVREVVAEAVELPDAFVQLRAPCLGEPGPVVPGGCAPLGELGERLADGGERDADALGGADEGDPAQGVTAVAALVARGAAAADQALGLVEVQGGDGGAAAGGELADRELVDLLWNPVHSSNPTDPLRRPVR